MSWKGNIFKASTPNEEHLACKNTMRAKQTQVQESTLKDTNYTKNILKNGPMNRRF